MVVDPQSWLDQCAAHLVLLYLASPRCGEEDVLADDTARSLAVELMEDRIYNRLEPDEAARLFMQHMT